MLTDGAVRQFSGKECSCSFKTLNYMAVKLVLSVIKLVYTSLTFKINSSSNTQLYIITITSSYSYDKNNL